MFLARLVSSLLAYLEVTESFVSCEVLRYSADKCLRFLTPV